MFLFLFSLGWVYQNLWYVHILFIRGFTGWCHVKLKLQNYLLSEKINRKVLSGPWLLLISLMVPLVENGLVIQCGDNYTTPASLSHGISQNCDNSFFMLLLIVIAYSKWFRYHVYGVFDLFFNTFWSLQKASSSTLKIMPWD